MRDPRLAASDPGSHQRRILLNRAPRISSDFVCSRKVVFDTNASMSQTNPAQKEDSPEGNSAGGAGT